MKSHPEHSRESERVPPQNGHPIDNLKIALGAGRIERREFLRQSVKLGLTVPAAYAVLNEVLGSSFSTEALAQVLPTTQMIDLRVKQINDVLKSPPYLAMLQKLYKEPEQTRFQLAKQIATPDALKNAGVSLVPGLRITTRVFEEPSGRMETIASCVAVASPPGRASSATQSPVFQSAANICSSVGEIVCVTVGS